MDSDAASDSTAFSHATRDFGTETMVTKRSRSEDRRQQKRRRMQRSKVGDCALRIAAAAALQLKIVSFANFIAQAVVFAATLIISPNRFTDHDAPSAIQLRVCASPTL